MNAKAIATSGGPKSAGALSWAAVLVIAQWKKAAPNNLHAPSVSDHLFHGGGAYFVRRRLDQEIHRRPA
jgi:hypothetical protein